MMTLTKQQLDAVHLLVDNRLTDKAIAERIGIDVRTIARWKKIPEFAKSLIVTQEDVFTTARRNFIAHAPGRLARKLERYQRYEQIIEERAAANKGRAVPGATTGLLAKRIKLGKDCIHEEYVVDTAISREMALLEQEIGKEAQEAGPLPNTSLPLNFSALSLNELESFEVLLAKLYHYSLIPDDQQKSFPVSIEDLHEETEREWKRKEKKMYEIQGRSTEAPDHDV